MNSTSIATPQSGSSLTRISDLEQRLKPATSVELVDRLQVLFASLPSASAGDAMELRIRAYVMALSRFSAETVSEAVAAVLNGSAGVDLRFVPTPPELATICRQCDAVRHREMERLRQRAPAIERQPTPEERARIVAKCDALAATLERTAARDPLKTWEAAPVADVLRGIAERARQRQGA